MAKATLLNVQPLHSTEKSNNPAAEGIFAQAELLGHENLHFKFDPASGLKAIIAIHNSSRGPALGGTRCIPYPTEQHAIADVMRLAQSMSYKSALANLPYGGGKAVLIRPQKINNPTKYFESYGDFINNLNGQFITAVDVGTRVADMDIIARRTPYVLSTSSCNGDPSFDTAKGVLRGIEAAVKVRLTRNDLEGCSVAIQGVGKVGYFLAQLLHQLGAKLFISDIDKELVQQCADELDASIVIPEQIMSVLCDVLSPCALGSSINAESIHQIKAKIVCGSANNQLAADAFGDILFQKDIFYVPDYIVNAGGLIHVVLGSSEEAQSRISGIYDVVIDIHERSVATQEASDKVANRIAQQILSESKQVTAHI